MPSQSTIVVNDGTADVTYVRTGVVGNTTTFRKSGSILGSQSEFSSTVRPVSKSMDAKTTLQLDKRGEQTVDGVTVVKQMGLFTISAVFPRGGTKADREKVFAEAANSLADPGVKSTFVDNEAFYA